MLDDHVASGSVPACVALVSRGDQTRAFVQGNMSRDGDEPVRRDTIFRIACMTKPITATAMMMLAERGKLRLDDPVDRLVPELANRRVLRRIDGPLDETVPALRPITIEDVMTFRLGLGLVFGDGYPIRKATQGLVGFGTPNPKDPVTPDEWVERLGCLPLMYQPGERWLYTIGSNLQGVLVARASGQPFDVFVQENILEPLGMSNTGFWISANKRARTITAYALQDDKLVLFDPPNGMYANRPSFPAGDSGMVSTADDYLRFARFMHGGLAPDGQRLLSMAALTSMQTDHLTPCQREGGRSILGSRRGWGYGMGVASAGRAAGEARGSYGWEGGFGTSWFNDPVDGLTGILLTQRVFEGSELPAVHRDFRKAAYAAISHELRLR